MKMNSSGVFDGDNEDRSDTSLPYNIGRVGPRCVKLLAHIPHVGRSDFEVVVNMNAPVN